METRESSPVAQRERPVGVTVLAVLAGIGGAMGLIGSLSLLGLGGLFVATAFGGLVFLVGIATLGVSAAALAFAYGAWQLREWAWVLGMGTFAASAVLTLLQVVLSYTTVVSAVVSLAIAGGVLYYLNQPEMEAAFGRS